MTTLWSIGHGAKSADEFLDRLRFHNIDCVVDVRTRPQSRWCLQFNKGRLNEFLAEHGISYDWCGFSMGGLGENVGYNAAVHDLVVRAVNENVAIMCSETSYLKCHRFTMLTPDLEARGARVIHIEYLQPQK